MRIVRDVVTTGTNFPHWVFSVVSVVSVVQGVTPKER
jgi:hypothetical protein